MAIATSTALLIAGTAAAAGSIGGGMIQSGAQAKMGKAQMEAAERMRREALVFAAPTAAELENLTKQVGLYERMYAQQTATIDQLQQQITDVYGPAILEQGKVLFEQLRGQSSGVVKSFNNQRDRQKKQLQAQLIERMGPGALTSSAGVNAMNDFDQKTSDMSAQIEEQALNGAVNRVISLTGGQDATSKGILNSYNSMSSLLNNIQTGYGNIQTRQANAAVGTASSVVGSAGSEYLGDIGMGRAITSGFQQFGQLAGYAAMMDGVAKEKETVDTELAGGFRTTPGGRAGISMGPSSYQNPWEAPQYSTMPDPTFGDLTFNK